MLNRAALFATLFAGAGLTAAALIGQPAAVAAEPQPQATVPVQVLEHAPVGWHLVYEADRAKLAYGVTNSDQILVMLSCAAGDPSVEVFGLATPEAGVVRLTSASATTVLPTEVKFDPMSGAAVVETQIPVTSRALEGFRETGRLTLAAEGDHAVPVHAMQAEQADVRAFFQHCGRHSV